MTSITKTKIFAGVACVGVIGTTIAAFNAGDEFTSVYEMYIVEINHSKESKSDIRKRYLPKFAKVLAPVFGCAAATIAMIILMGTTSVKAQKALIGSLAVTKAEFDALQRLDTKDGDEIENTVIDAYADEIQNVKEGLIILYEPYTENFLITTEKEIEKVLRFVNKKLQNNYIVRLDSIIRALGGDQTDVGTYLGWEMSNNVQMHMWKKTGGPYIGFDLSNGYDVRGKNVIKIVWDIPPMLLDDYRK